MLTISGSRAIATGLTLVAAAAPASLKKSRLEVMGIPCQ
jgi:hypothetical protein